MSSAIEPGFPEFLENALKVDLICWLSSYGFLNELETLDIWWCNLPWSIKERTTAIFRKYGFDCSKRQVIAALYRECIPILEKYNKKDSLCTYDPLEIAERACGALDKRLADFIASGGQL